jgi:hypothetical protein
MLVVVKMVVRMQLFLRGYGSLRDDDTVLETPAQERWGKAGGAVSVLARAICAHVERTGEAGSTLAQIQQR